MGGPSLERKGWVKRREGGGGGGGVGVLELLPRHFPLTILVL
jgi:hypothetical protein